MASHDNKETVRRFYEIIVSGNLDDLDRYVSRDVTDRNPFPGQGPGLEGIKESARQVRGAFSDYRLEVHDMIAEGDRVASRTTYHGRHTGEFLGIPPPARSPLRPGWTCSACRAAR